MVRSRLSPFVFLALLLATLISPGIEAKQPGRPLRVVCTILPVHCFTLNVAAGVPGLQIDLLLPPSRGCPHDYDLTPGDMIKISQADLIIANGLGMEAFLDKPLQGAASGTRLVQAAKKVEPLLSRPIKRRLLGRSDHGGHGRHPEPSLNGHAWVSPKAAVSMVETIASALGGLDPAHTGQYQENARRYTARLNAIFNAMRDVVKGSRNSGVITSHDSFDYLARDTGLKIAGIIQPQLGVEPSPREMAELVRLIRSRQVSAILNEPQVPDRTARILSRETGVPFFELDPVATGKPAPETYEKAMQRNIAVLRTALR